MIGPPLSLAQIKAMFRPGTIWTVERSTPKIDPATGHRTLVPTPMLKDTSWRWVERHQGNAVVWNTGHLDHLFMTLPKRPEVIKAIDGLLTITYTGMEELICYRRQEGAEADRIRAKLVKRIDAAKQLKAEAEADIARIKQENKEREEREARDRMGDIAAKILAGKPVTSREMLDLCREIDIPIPLRSQGTLLKRVVTISPASFQYYKQKGRSLRMKTCPTQLYEQAKSRLETAAEIAQGLDGAEPDDPEILRLFGEGPRIETPEPEAERSAPPPAQAPGKILIFPTPLAPRFPLPAFLL